MMLPAHQIFMYLMYQCLTYRGRLDNSRPGNGIPLTGEDLENAIVKTISGKAIENQYPSAGCSIKWKKSN